MLMTHERTNTMKSACWTDIGIKKKVNQDACVLMEADTDQGKVGFAAVSDGMGGLRDGELASEEMTIALSAWFRNRLPIIISRGGSREDIEKSLGQTILSVDRQLDRYSRQHGNCGTTVSGVLLCYGKYLCVNVGDSRVYRIGNRSIMQLTHDQSLVQQMVDNGEITEEEAKTHPSQSVLLQCIGAGGEAVPEYTSGSYEDGDIFLVCSDGFRHRWSEKEMLGMFPDRKHIKQRNMAAALRRAVEEVMRRGEKDNITVVAVAP